MEGYITTRQRRKAVAVTSLISDINQHIDTEPETFRSFSSNTSLRSKLIQPRPKPSPAYSTFHDISVVARKCTDVLSQLRTTDLYREYRDVIDNQSEFKIEPNLEECSHLNQCKRNLSSKQLTSLLRSINLQVRNETSSTFDRLSSEARHKHTSDGNSPNIDSLLAEYSTTSQQLHIPSVANEITDASSDLLQLEVRGTADIEPDYNKAYISCVKRVPKSAKQLMTSRYIILNNSRKVASLCTKEVRKQAQRSFKLSRESIARARRLMREANICWRRYERVEREARKKAEREALEQHKMEEERKEARRQQRKLNFLITQTELYAHFVSGKKAARLKSESGVDPDGELSNAGSDNILARLDDAPDKNGDPLDSYSSETAKKQALEAVRGALERDEERDKLYIAGLQDKLILENNETAEQPEMFQGSIKSYQLKGMRWLAGLYSQGINGILADEMGLGKTIQTLALLAHLAEKENIWGPFLVVSPAGTLYNWQQECDKFVPGLKVLPYWGNAQDRRTTRQYMNKKQLLSCSDSPFHILITSYQLAVRDSAFLNRMTWQYMVLDEAQAIKSSASQRWQVLLGFKCRNRLLLTGTPIQNSMAELWALLHFIMPSIFDSHDEFKEWFSKDIESHAGGKSVGLDQDQLSRLHLILKPFMLRRVKKDVEHEMAAKIEMNLQCELTLRQKVLYQGLKNKLSLEEIFQHSNLSRGTTATSLLNIVMQFRKVCNHPELFDRRDVSSPLICEKREYSTSRLLYYYSAEEERFSLYKRNLLNIHSSKNIYESSVCDSPNGIPSLVSLLCVSISNWDRLWNGDFLQQTRVLEDFKIQLLILLHYQTWSGDIHRDRIIMPCVLHRIESIQSPYNLPPLIFTNIHSIYEFQSESTLEPNILPRLLSLHTCYKAVSSQLSLYASTRKAELMRILQIKGGNDGWLQYLREGSLEVNTSQFEPLCSNKGGLHSIFPPNGWSNITIPNKEILITDSGKLRVLDILLVRLKAEGHRVLIYSQMTRMIDLLEEYVTYRRYRYIRLDGSSRISDRRDMVDDFQNKADIFVFLLSTRAGGLGINLTAADTVIFYDSDWNPTVDQQAMDRAHRLGQTKQVTVYRLVTRGTIDERILERAREKSEIQHMVISGGEFKMDTLKPKEMASLLLDSEEIESKLLAKQRERREQEERIKEKKRKYKQSLPATKKVKLDSSLPPSPQFPSSSSRASSPSIISNSSLINKRSTIVTGPVLTTATNSP